MESKKIYEAGRMLLEQGRMLVELSGMKEGDDMKEKEGYEAEENMEKKEGGGGKGKIAVITANLKRKYG